jgi:hypothetical protein
MRYLIVGILFIAGCANQPLPGPSKYIPPVVVDPPLPVAVNLTPPKFYILTETTCESAFKDESAYFSVSAEGYQSLSENVQELRRYILELQSLVEFYMRSMDLMQEAAEKHNETVSNPR